MAREPARAHPGAPSAALALGATLAIQVYASFAATASAVLAPAIAQSLGVPASWIGAWVGLVYAGAMVASLLSGAYIARHGAIRVSQACVAACALGIAGVAATGALPATLAIALAVVAALVMGAGYGPITPASSDVLARTTPSARMSLVFSIKQTGVPAGTALAGAALPALALAIGWRGALALAAVAGIAVVLAAQPIRAALDTDRRKVASAGLRGAMRAVREVFRHRELASLAMLSFAYSATQVCLTSFLVVHLTGSLGWSLVAAGLALSPATIAGVVGRIAWGAASDHTRRPRVVLGVIGVVASACAALTAASTAAWPALALLVVVAAFGATAIGWNGVMLAEVARLAPPGQAGATTGATGFVTFGGVVVGPPLFAVLSAATGGTQAGFIALALLSGVTGLILLTTAWKSARYRESEH